LITLGFVAAIPIPNHLLTDVFLRFAMTGFVFENEMESNGELFEAHLRRILKFYADYYNRVRTHRSLDKDTPVSRSVQRTGVISSRAILGGLHHRYARV
jgi:hypothetical protein